MEELTVDHLWKLRSGNPVLSDVCFSVKAGEVVALLGPSGAGKSTVLRCVNHLDSPDSGRIFVRGSLMGYQQKGDALYELKEKEVCRQRSRIGMVFQGFHLFRHLTVLENVILAPMEVLHLKRDEAVQRALKTLEKVGLAGKENSLPSQLSGGQQQRVAIARVLVVDPTLLLLDEPTSALDPVLSKEVIETVKGLAVEGRTMLIATHDMAMAREVADRVIFMEGGKIEADVSCDEFFNSPASIRVRKFLNWFPKS